MLGEGFCNIGESWEDLTEFELQERGDEICYYYPLFGTFTSPFKLQMTKIVTKLCSITNKAVVKHFKNY